MIKLKAALLLLLVTIAIYALQTSGLEIKTETIFGIAPLTVQGASQAILLLISIPIYYSIFRSPENRRKNAIDGLSVIIAGLALIFQIVFLYAVIKFGETRTEAAHESFVSEEPEITSGDDYIIIDGPIGGETATNVAKIYFKKRFNRIIIASPGGVLNAAYELGFFIHEHGLGVVVVDHCESACIVVAASSAHLSAQKGTMFGFHQTSVMTDDVNSYVSFNNKESDLLYFSKLSKLGIPRDIIEKARKTPPTEIYYLSAEELFNRKIVDEIFD